MEPNMVPEATPNELADDLLRGADEIAEFIFGKRGGRRKIYYLAETSHLPVWRGPLRQALHSLAVDRRPGKPGKASSNLNGGLLLRAWSRVVGSRGSLVG